MNIYSVYDTVEHKMVNINNISNEFDYYTFSIYSFKNDMTKNILKKILFFVTLKGLSVEFIDHLGDHSYSFSINNCCLGDCYINDILSIDEIKKIDALIKKKLKDEFKVVSTYSYFLNSDSAYKYIYQHLKQEYLGNDYLTKKYNLYEERYIIQRLL